VQKWFVFVQGRNKIIDMQLVMNWKGKDEIQKAVGSGQ
jgi:hypothetical protein